jgi:threonine dehydrogenase-like Zn-dependent dehydrogenase
VIGQGVVGLLTTVLLAEFPLAGLVSFDRLAARRAASLAAGAQTSLDPMELPRAEAGGYFISHSQEYTGADLVYEISGSPSALNLAIDCAGYNARIVVGSWYGKKQASLELGGKFHRSHIRLISSQVSRIPPELSGQWTKQRRLDWAWQSLQRIQPEKWITHRFPIQNAAEAYQLLEKGDDRNPPLQVVLNYPD